METGLYLRDASEAQWPLIRHVLAVPSALQEAVFVERTRGYAKLPVPFHDAGALRDGPAAIPAFESVDISTADHLRYPSLPQQTRQAIGLGLVEIAGNVDPVDRKSTRLNSSHQCA